MTVTILGYRLWAGADTADRLLIVLIIFSVQKPPPNNLISTASRFTYVLLYTLISSVAAIEHALLAVAT